MKNPNEDRIKKLLQLELLQKGKPKREDYISKQEVENLVIDFNANEQEAWSKYFGIASTTQQEIKLEAPKENDESPF